MYVDEAFEAFVATAAAHGLCAAPFRYGAEGAGTRGSDALGAPSERVPSAWARRVRIERRAWELSAFERAEPFLVEVTLA
jgi:hypothetical protein